MEILFRGRKLASMSLLGVALTTGCSSSKSSPPLGSPDGGDDAPLDADLSGSSDAADAGDHYTSPSAANAKLLGYAFGDGNYFPPFPAPADLTLTSGNAFLTDFVKLACAAGYDGHIVAPKESPSQIECASFTHVTTGQQTVKIQGFHYPTADFETFAANATHDDTAAFFSGELPMEGGSGYHGGPNGRIEDQSIGFGPYTTHAQIQQKMVALRTLLEHGGGFTTVQLDPAGCEASGDCTSISINANQEACKFNSIYGYNPVVWDRVPGATPGPNGVFIQPAACP